MLLTFEPTSFIFSFIPEFIEAIAVTLIVLKVPYILFAIWVGHVSFPMHFVVLPLPNVLLTCTRPFECSLALQDVHLYFTFVCIAILIGKEALAMLTAF